MVVHLEVHLRHPLRTAPLRSSRGPRRVGDDRCRRRPGSSRCEATIEPEAKVSLVKQIAIKKTAFAIKTVGVKKKYFYCFAYVYSVYVCLMFVNIP